MTTTYQSNRAQGLCGRCGARPERGAYCDDCRPHIRIAVQDVYARRKAHKLCTRCGVNPKGTTLLCPDCRTIDIDRQRARASAKTTPGEIP